MIKVLLLGLGRWGVNHLRNLHALPVELYVAEVRGAQLEPARQLDLPEERLTTDYREFLPKVDCAVIATPAQTHFPLGKEFVEAGKDVFVEKPIALASSEAKELAELADQRKRILQVGHIFRFDPGTMWVRDAIETGQFGQIHMLRGHFGGFKRPRSDTGVTFADGIHFVDLFNFVLGTLPKTVLAVQQDFLGRGKDDTSFLSLEYQSPRGKIWATVETDYFIPGKFRKVIVVGEKLSAVCDYTVAQYKIKTYENRHLRGGDDFKGVEGAVHQIECAPEEPLLVELRAFINSVQTRQAPRADAWAGYNAVRVLEAAQESARLGRRLVLKTDARFEAH